MTAAQHQAATPDREGGRQGFNAVYVLEAVNDGGVMHLDLATGALCRIAANLYWPADIALSHDGATAYISAFSNRLTQLDLSNCALSPLYTPGIDPAGALASASDGTLYTAARSDHPSDYKGAHICAVDPATATVTPIALYIAIPCDIEIEPSGTTALMATVAVNDLYCLRRLDLACGSITEIAILPLSNRDDRHPTFAIARDNTALIARGNQLLRVDLASGAVEVSRLLLPPELAGLPFKDIALQPDGAHALILAGTGIIRANLATGEISQPVPQNALPCTAARIAIAPRHPA